MRDLNRRSFLARSGVLVAAAGSGGLLAAGPADAANITACDDVILDQGGEVFNIKMSTYGAVGNGTTDDTAAIQAAVNAAAAVGGTVFAPAGVYKITSQIEIPGSVSLVGHGPKTADTGNGNTVFLCGAAGAGILVTGSGTYRDFQCNGNATATHPLQHGKIVGGVAQATSGATFISVWASNSASHGWWIYGAQNSAYHDCRSRLNAGDGLYIDGGAGGLHIWHWAEQENGGIGVHSDATVTGGTGTYVDHTEDIHFYSGICDGSSSTNPGTGKMSLKKATNWSFPDLSIVGNDNTSGPTVVLDQSYGYGLDFSGCWIWANTNSPIPGIQVNGTDPSSPTGTPRAFLIMNDVQWHDATITIVNAPNANRFYARSWMYDNAAPVGPSGGPAADTLLIGRTGAWVTPTYASGWSSQGIKYRINADGAVQFMGSATASNLTASQLFTLGLGYRPDHTLELPVQNGSGSTYVTITSAGVVSTPNPGLFGSVWMDGVSFPVR
jgi:hypothetical protein